MFMERGRNAATLLLSAILYVSTPALSGTPGSETYTYDELGRLVRVDFPDGKRSSYSYDAAGNRTTINSGADATPPGAPTSLSATAVSSSQVNLSWNAVTDTGGSGLSGYKVFRNGSTTALGSSSVTSYADTTTSGSTTYSYIVKAFDGSGNVSAASNTATVTTPDTIAPSTPINLTAAAVSTSQINLSWSASGDSGGSGLKGYKITRNGAALVTTTTSATTYSDTGLVSATGYTYTVAAYDNAGNISTYSTSASATTLAPAIGQFQLVSTSHSNRGASGDIATANVKNVGSATITGIAVSCGGGSWTAAASSSSIAAGATGVFQCEASAFAQNSVTMGLTGSNATNSPFSFSF